MQPQEASIHIDARPDDVYAFVSDVTNMGRLSPVCYRTEWLGGASGPAEGARFKGWNKAGLVRWSRECEVTRAEPGKAFGFATFVKGRESTRWLYTFETDGTGTKVTEAYEPVYAPFPINVLEKLMASKFAADARKNLETSLANLKSVIESQG